MIERIRNWWAGLSIRERWLVGIAGALALGVLLWALGRPAYAAFVDLDNAHRAAIDREGRVAAKVKLPAKRPAKAAATSGAVAVDQFLAPSAGRIGLTPHRNDHPRSGQAPSGIPTA